MSKQAPLFLFLIVLGIIGVVALVFWNSIRASFVEPISALILVIVALISSFDQIYLWGFLLFILILLTVTRLGKTAPEGPSNRVYHLKVTSAGRLRFWETQVYLLTRSRSPSRYSIHEVRRLLVSVLGYRLHLDTNEAELRLKSGAIEIPPQYAAFAELDQEPEEQDDRLTEWLKAFITMLRGKQKQVIQEREKVLNDLIQFMENQLEIEHDHRHR